MLKQTDGQPDNLYRGTTSLPVMSQPTSGEQSAEDIELANGDTLAERVEKINLDAEETVSVEEMRERLGLTE